MAEFTASSIAVLFSVFCGIHGKSLDYLALSNSLYFLSQSILYSFRHSRFCFAFLSRIKEITTFVSTFCAMLKILSVIKIIYDTSYRLLR